MTVMERVEVIKRNTAGRETWRYSGQVLARRADAVLLEAFFNRADLPFHGIVLRENDRFIELYFSQRWYNIFEIHDKNDDRTKAWYCNVTYPANLSESEISYIDLALDLLVFPDGRQLVLDEDEFDDLHLPPQTASQARAALAELQAIFANPAMVDLGRMVNQ